MVTERVHGTLFSAVFCGMLAGYLAADIAASQQGGGRWRWRWGPDERGITSAAHGQRAYSGHIRALCTLDCSARPLHPPCSLGSALSSYGSAENRSSGSPAQTLFSIPGQVCPEYEKCACWVIFTRKTSCCLTDDDKLPSDLQAQHPAFSALFRRQLLPNM